MPPERVISFLRVRACGECGGHPSWGRLGDSGLSLLLLLLPSLAGLAPCGAVFFGVRLGGRGIPGNVLLIEIYVLACSEPPLQRVSSEKSAQLVTLRRETL